jgi:hypothetical protein
LLSDIEAARHICASSMPGTDEADLARWIWKFAWRVGRMQGSAEYRVFAL